VDLTVHAQPFLSVALAWAVWKAETSCHGQVEPVLVQAVGLVPICFPVAGRILGTTEMEPAHQDLATAAVQAVACQNFAEHPPVQEPVEGEAVEARGASVTHPLVPSLSVRAEAMEVMEVVVVNLLVAVAVASPVPWPSPFPGAEVMEAMEAAEASEAAVVNPLMAVAAASPLPGPSPFPGAEVMEAMEAAEASEAAVVNLLMAVAAASPLPGPS